MIPCLLPNPTTNRPVLLHKTPPKKIKTDNNYGQSSFSRNPLNQDYHQSKSCLGEKTHSKTHLENPSFLLGDKPKHTKLLQTVHKDHHHHQPATAKPNQSIRVPTLRRH
jgi:hypothetical protein